MAKMFHKYRLFSLALMPVFLVLNTERPATPPTPLPMTAAATLERGSIHSVAFSPDAKTIAIASAAGVWLYDVHGSSQRYTLQRKDEVFLRTAH
jgi:hypothetical protein